MLPPHIIEELRRRERFREEQARQEQPRLELPLPPRRRRTEPVEEKRGITIIDLW